MSVQVQITLTKEAEQIVRKLQTLPVAVMKAIAAGMDKANQFAVGRIQKDHLTGTGPFPVELHKLGKRSSRLLGSVNASPAVVEGETVRSGIGSNVSYAAIHEFGGRIHKERSTKFVRLKTDARGNLVRNLKGGAIFAKKKHNRFKSVRAVVPQHDINIPERAPFRTGIAEAAPDYRREISRAIIAAMKGDAPAT